MNLAKALLDDGRLNDAANRTAWLVSQYPTTATAWTLQGQVQQRQTLIAEARQSFQRAVALDPGDLLAQVGLADIFALEDGDLLQALQQLDVAFSQGRHSYDLISRLIALNTLLENQEGVASLSEGLRQESNETANTISKDASAFIRKYKEMRVREAVHGVGNVVTIGEPSVGLPTDGSRQPAGEDISQTNQGFEATSLAWRGIHSLSDPKIVERIRKECGNRPKDPEALALLIKATIGRGDMYEANQLVAFSRQIVESDRPTLAAARGLYALRSGDHALARQLYDEAKRKAPLDSSN
jgi:tetratricopeptide (TPR) repeat protein